MAEGFSKKQLKELKKLEKMQSRNLEQKNNTVKWIAISIVCALFLVLFVGVVLVAKNKNKPATADGSTAIANNGHERMIENAVGDATNSAERAQEVVTLVEYADFQCPACKQYHPIVKELLRAFPDQLKLVFKNFPLISIHPNALPSAIAAEASGMQDKYFEFADLLYEQQEEWSGLPDPTDKFEEYAKSIGLDVERFKKDLSDPSISKLIEDHRSEGITNGVAGTPTFFVNGQRINTPSSLEDFKKIISDELAKGDQSVPVETEPTSSSNPLLLQE